MPGLLIKFIEDISAEQFYSASARYVTALHPPPPKKCMHLYSLVCSIYAAESCMQYYNHVKVCYCDRLRASHHAL